MTPTNTQEQYDVLGELSLLYRTCEANIMSAFYNKITLDELNDIMVCLHNQIEREVSKLNDL